MALWTVHDVVEEIEGVACLLQSRRNTSRQGAEEREKSLVANCVRKIEAMAQLSAQDAATLFDKVGKTSLSEELKQMICDGIDATLTKETQLPSGPAMVKPQTLTHIQNYLTEEDWKALESDLSLTGKAGILLKRLKALGIRSCSESTTKYCLALLLAMLPGHAFPTYDVVFSLVHDFKKMFASSKGATKAPWVQCFPELLSQLSEGH